MKEYTKKEKLEHIQLMLENKEQIIYFYRRADVLSIDLTRFKEFNDRLGNNINNDGSLNYDYADIYKKYVGEVKHLQYLSKTLSRKYNLELREQFLLDLKEIVEVLPEDEEYPLSWYDLDIKGGYYVNNVNDINHFKKECGITEKDKSTIRTKVQAESIQVLPELLQLRDAYRKEWVPNVNKSYYSIDYGEGELTVCTWLNYKVFKFQSQEVARLFLNRFRDKLEIYFKGLI